MSFNFGIGVPQAQGVGLMDAINNQLNQNANLIGRRLGNVGKDLSNQAASINLQTLGAMNSARLKGLDLLNQKSVAESPYWGPQASAQVGLTNSQAGLYGQQAAKLKEELPYAGDLAKAELQNAQISQAKFKMFQDLYNRGGLPGMTPQAQDNQQVPLGSALSNGAAYDSNANALPLNPQSVTNLNQALRQPGIPRQPMAAGGGVQMGQPEMDNSPQAQQARAIQQAQSAFPFLMLSGKPEVAAQLMNQARQGTPLQQKAIAEDSARMKEYNEQADAAEKLLPMLQDYKDSLKKVNKANFTPLYRNTIAPIVSAPFKDLANQGNAMMPIIAHMLGVPARSMTNQEMSRLTGVSFDPAQPLESLQLAIPRIEKMMQQKSQTRKEAMAWRNKNNSLNNFEPSYLNGLLNQKEGEAQSTSFNPQEVYQKITAISNPIEAKKLYQSLTPEQRAQVKTLYKGQ